MNHSQISVIGDAETIEGFEIAGIVSDENTPTLITVRRDDPAPLLAGAFRRQVLREDIGIVFVCDFVSQKISDEISRYRGTLPSVMIIPSKGRL